MSDTAPVSRRKSFWSSGRILLAAALVVAVVGGMLAEHYYIQAKGLHDGGVDYFLLETCQDTLNIKAGILGIMRLNGEVETPLPIAAQ